MFSDQLHCISGRNQIVWGVFMGRIQSDRGVLEHCISGRFQSVWGVFMGRIQSDRGVFSSSVHYMYFGDGLGQISGVFAINCFGTDLAHFGLILRGWQNMVIPRLLTGPSKSSSATLVLDRFTANLCRHESIES